MREHPVIHLSRRHMAVLAPAAACLMVLLATSQTIHAQEAQESYDQKFKIAEDIGGVSVTCSADGKYVFVAGQKGLLVSNDYGKTGSWMQTVRMK